MTVTNCEDRKMERRNLLTCLSTVLAAVQRVKDSEEVLEILSAELAACGFQNVVLKYGEKERNIKIAHVALPSQVKNSIEEQLKTSLLEREFKITTVPHCKQITKGEVVLCSSEQVLPVFLGVSWGLLENALPMRAMMIPVQKNLLAVTSDSFVKDDVATFSAFKDVVESTISNVCFLEGMREQNEFTERIIKSVQEGILMEDPEGRITFVNPTLLEMLKYTEEELIGHHYSIIACPEYIETVEKEARKRPKGIRSQYEACLLRKDGVSVPVIVSATPLFEKGEYSGTVAAFTDVSSQKEAEKEIRNLKEFSENIITSMHEAIIIEDAKGVITFVNPKLEELLEREKNELIGTHWQEFTAPEYILKVEEETARRVHGISGQYEVALLTKSRKQVPVMVGATPTFENGQFTGVISVCVDLTVVKEKEREIKQKNEDLRLLSTINHALNKGETLKNILDTAVNKIQVIFDSDFIVIMVLREDRRSVRPEIFAIYPGLHVCGDAHTVLQDQPFIIEEGSSVETVIKEKRTHLIFDQNVAEIFKGILTPEVALKIQEYTKVRSAIILPLLAEDQVIGVLVMGSQRELGQNDLNRLESLSKHLALAIDHAWLDETFQKTSQKLQNSLSEQTILRQLMEKLYGARNQKEVMNIAAEKLEQLGYKWFAVGLKEPGDAVHLLQVYPEDFMDDVAKTVQKATGKLPHLDRIPLPETALYLGAHKKRIALATDNIELKEKNVISLPMNAFIQAWAGGDSSVQEEVSHIIDIKSIICIPLRMEEEFVGAFVVGSDNVLKHHDFVVLETMGQIVTEALKRLQYSETLEKKTRDLEFSNQQLSLLQEVNNALNSTMDLDQILKTLVQGMHSVYGYDAPSIYLLSDDRKHLVVTEFYINSKLLNGITKLVKINLKNYRIPLFEGSMLKKVIDERTPLITNNIPPVLKDFTEKKSLRRLAGALYKLASSEWIAALPLIAEDKVVGMLVFGSGDEVKEEHINALSGFLNQAALAIAKAKMYEELKEANQMKSEFIDITSHELRTPLTSIKLYLELIKMRRYGELNPEMEEKIGLIQASAERLREIIDQTLVSSKIKKEKLKLKKEEISMIELVNKVMRELQPLWEAKDQKIEVHGPYEFPLVKADWEAMWNVLNALIENAIKYSPEKTRITVKLYDHTKEIEVAVIDEGIGIQQKYLEDIFKEFYIVPAESEYARMDGRAGLGLFIAKGYVEEHGGKIWVESVFGLGSTFHFTIPK